MSFSLIQSGQVAGEVLRLLATNNALAQQVRQFFGPRCDCDAVAWVIAQIQAENQEVIDAVKAMIAGEVVAAPAAPARSILSANGDTFVLLRTWCEGQVRKGEVMNTDGTLTTVTVEAVDTTCV